MHLSRTLVVLDLETTGTWIEKDKIIEIGMVKCRPDGSREQYVKRVNPGIAIPAAITRLTGISDEDVKDAPFFGQLAKDVLLFLEDADLAGFNVERFDLPLLEREIFEAGLRFDWRTRTVYDAQKIYHLHEKRDLTAAYKFYCEKALLNAHTALGDSEAVVDILASQVDKYGDAALGVDSLKDFDYARSSEFFDDERKFRWWNGELYPVFGKYARKYSLKEIAARDTKYLEWLLTTDFSDEVKAMIRELLQGRTPALKA